MGYRFASTDIEWVYPEKAGDLLRWWREMDHLCRTQVASRHSRFRKEWLFFPDEFVLAVLDGRLIGAVHVDNRKRSALCHIVVHEDYQRTNIGWLLALRGLVLVFLVNRKARAHCSIPVGNRPAQRLAGALGFKRIAVYNNRIMYRLNWPAYRDGVGRVFSEKG